MVTLFLVLEKYVFKWQKHGNAFTVHLRRLYTLAVVWFGWFLFRFDDMGLLGHALRSLFGGGSGWNGDNAHYTLKSYLFILLVAMIACTPVIPFLVKRLTSAAEGYLEAERAVEKCTGGPGDSCECLSCPLPCQ